MSETELASGQARLAELRTSARGWHGVQLATIGFVGLCGVLQRGRSDNPTWLQVLALLLALAALVLACAGTFLVARVAWPLYGARGSAETPGDLARDAARLRRGLVHTFTAVAVVALAAASGWWPQTDSKATAGATVSVEATNGQRACGPLVDVGPGRIGVTVNGSPVAVALADVATVAPAGGC